MGVSNSQCVSLTLVINMLLGSVLGGGYKVFRILVKSRIFKGPPLSV